jgi:hypothetical protein
MSTILLYTDPGSGAMIWQLLVAAGLGAAFYFRHYLDRVRTLLANRRDRRREIT